MENFIIEGGVPLRGTVSISGAKNAAVAILPAAILIKGKCRIENIPNISDILLCYDILNILGAKITHISKNEVEIDCTDIHNDVVPTDIARKFRASYYFIGSLLGRFKDASVGFPGGCNFGSRPIDQHIKGFELLGSNVSTEGGVIHASAEKLTGNSIYLDVVTVGATINIMLTAVLAEGTTVIENAAREPHVVDLANFLNTMGANIKGAGTDVIKIYGVSELHGGSTYSIMPDQLEAGTFMVAAAASKGDVLITNCITKHLDSISAKLVEIGVNVEEGESGDSIRVSCNRRTTKTSIKTLPYPGFPTDMHPQMAVLLSVSEGISYINESVFDSRFQYADELNKLGAKIKVDGKIAVIEGVNSLIGGQVSACDLRAGAALMIAGLIAEGTTKIDGVEHIYRGYENIVNKFQDLGGKIIVSSNQ